MNDSIKSSFDTYNPTDEQKLRMLKNIQKNAYATNVVNFKRIYIPVVYAAVAAFVFFIGGGILNPQPHTLNVPQIAAIKPDIPDTFKVQKPHTNNLSQTHNKQSLSVTPKDNSQPKRFEQVFESVDSKKETENIQSVQLAVNEVPQNIQTPMARNIAEPAAYEDAQSTIEYKDYTYDEFCDKLGYDIATTVKVPDDMQNITQTENSMAVDDAVEWDVTFIGDGARCININASTDMSKNDEYINGDYKKTDVNGNEAVVFYDENYTAYMNTQNASYKITTVEITEQELSDVIVSIAK